LKQISLRTIPKQVKVIKENIPFPLSQNRKLEIEEHWNKINQEGTFHRGEVFSVTSIIENKDFCEIKLAITDYAHYLHTVRTNMMDAEACQVVYGAGLVETKDNVLVFGEMGSNTVYPGRLQCVGGGLSEEDHQGDVLDLQQSVLRELSEELGLDPNMDIKEVSPMYMKTGGSYNFIVILYHLKSTLTKIELKEKYQMFCVNLLENKLQPEFANIIFLNNTKQDIKEFLHKDKREQVDYLTPFLLEIACDR
jgi:8-oxo-dGTP pyrophosphatase MutT (NUDIX family)